MIIIDLIAVTDEEVDAYLHNMRIVFQGSRDQNRGYRKEKHKIDLNPFRKTDFVPELEISDRPEHSLILNFNYMDTVEMELLL